MLPPTKKQQIELRRKITEELNRDLKRQDEKDIEEGSKVISMEEVEQKGESILKGLKGGNIEKLLSKEDKKELED